MTTEEMEQRLNAGGYYLRDDRPYREGDPYFKGREEAYSLHTVSPFERLQVWAGPRVWAVQESFYMMFGGTIQLKWSDETEWKDMRPLDPQHTTGMQLDACKSCWAADKAKWNLKHDAEFRIKPC